MKTESKILKVAIENNFHKVWNCKKVSNHPDDDYLRIALVEIKREIIGKTIKQEFATFIFNGTLGGFNESNNDFNGGFVSGHYFDNFTSAMNDYKERN